MNSATIKLFLPHGDPKRLRTGEISNWSGKALAAPRTELDELLLRDECDQSGVYMLFGVDSDTDDPRAYIGEAEVVRERLKQHRAKDFWLSVVVFVSKDGNLTKGHIRYLEARLLEEARAVGRYKLENVQASGARLPESDQHDMEVFLEKIRQLLPVLGGDLLTPVRASRQAAVTNSEQIVICRIKGAEARGQLTPNGFVILAGSTAVAELRPSAERSHPFVIPVRQRLLDDGVLVPDGTLLRFTRDWEFSSPSSAAAAVHGGGANGWKEWKGEDGRMLQEIVGR